ncbi:hypothetical protein DICPUDRAFT_147016 [Dictyostelium purpureum]|uniref:Uncharacterized protein n=1 Tax=Dictyostelium purpureum TaxID=5786 RepID=F0Z7F9_DICPU|nr:uncharacterized protein DICPUDRAFT_147016 [Dictyostelium purpureum]EGC40134.1 hypothetical protein DICPUDRAFT_147016 [Dictyostelium purpureum]|eukprot:XP_003283324.1 hypothetical protein DICPUDRAFT_147016 [Dictyostelium purpureum]
MSIIKSISSMNPVNSASTISMLNSSGSTLFSDNESACFGNSFGGSCCFNPCFNPCSSGNNNIINIDIDIGHDYLHDQEEHQEENQEEQEFSPTQSPPHEDEELQHPHVRFIIDLNIYYDPSPIQNKF